MNELYKLKEERNPRISKNLTLYLVENKFTYKDLSENNQLFKETHQIILEFLTTHVSFETVIKVFNKFNIEIGEEKFLEQLGMFKGIDRFDMFLKVVTNEIKKVINNKEEFALFLLFMNHWLFNHGFSLMALNPYLIANIKEMIKNDVREEFLYQTILRYYLYSLGKNKKSLVFLTEDVIKKINDLKDVLKIQYQVNKLYIYGSYSKNKQNEYSDLDVYIKSDDVIKRSNIVAIKDFLQTVLKIKVDVTTKGGFIKDGMLEVF